MAASSYRVYFDGKAITPEQLDLLEEITVVQEMDVAWVARYRFGVHTDEQGVWTSEDHVLAVPFKRVRIEARASSTGAFVPLIEGPVVATDAELSSDPGKSTLTVEVHDDSVLMNRRERVEVYEQLTADKVAQRLFRDAGLVQSDVEAAPPPSGGFPPVYVQRETDIQFLRRLARDVGKHAYVLPGAAAGASTGAFKSVPVAPDGLPELVLLGAGRNVKQLDIRAALLRPATAKANSLAATDKQLATATSTLGAIPLLGSDKPVDDANAAFVLLPPGRDSAVDVGRWTAAATERSAYAFEATGRVTFDGYPAVLSPYRVVTVRGIDGRSSGNWLVSMVTHTLTRASYAQEFKLQRNARSAGSGGASGSLPSVF